MMTNTGNNNEGQGRKWKVKKVDTEQIDAILEPKSAFYFDLKATLQRLKPYGADIDNWIKIIGRDYDRHKGPRYYFTSFWRGDRDPSFVVDVSKGYANDFPVRPESYDLVDAYQVIHNVDIYQAADAVAELMNVDITDLEIGGRNVILFNDDEPDDGCRTINPYFLQCPPEPDLHPEWFRAWAHSIGNNDPETEMYRAIPKHRREPDGTIPLVTIKSKPKNGKEAKVIMTFHPFTHYVNDFEPDVLDFGTPENPFPTHRWIYRDEDGLPRIYEVRFNKADGGKDMPLASAVYDHNGVFSHVRWGLPEGTRRILYNLRELTRCRDWIEGVITCEGPKVADAANARLKRFYGPGDFPDMPQGAAPYIAVSWPGGAKNWHLADWSPVNGLRAAISPDHDLEGYNSAIGLRRHLKKIASSVDVVKVPVEFPEKWDLADSNPDGFTDEDIISMIQKCF